MALNLKITTDVSSNLKITGGEILDGLLSFDRVDDFVILDSVPAITGQKVVKTNFYIPASAVEVNQDLYICWMADNSDNPFLLFVNAYASGTTPALQIITRNSQNVCFATSLPVDLTDNILEVEVQLNNNYISNVLLDGYILAPDVSTAGADRTDHVAYVGARESGTGPSEMWEGYIWNLRIYDGSSNLHHSWAGRPDGNTNAAWEDGIGAIDGSITGDPSLGSLVDTTGNRKLQLLGG